MYRIKGLGLSKVSDRAFLLWLQVRHLKPNLNAA